MVRPRSTAFLASKPAAIITFGLEVLVHEVIAAITIDPCFKECSTPLYVNFWFKLILSDDTPNPLKPCLFGKHC